MLKAVKINGVVVGQVEELADSIVNAWVAGVYIGDYDDIQEAKAAVLARVHNQFIKVSKLRCVV